MGKKKILIKSTFLWVLLGFSCSFNLFSQDKLSTDSLPNIILPMLAQDAIANYDIPEDIMNNLMMNPGALKKPSVVTKRRGESAVQKRQGFRVQVFSDGRNPSTLQARATARGNAIVAKFPKYRGQIYSFSSSPNWYTRIGNFKTHEEASKALVELKQAFPAFAGEMRVVKSQITIIK